MSAEIIPFDDAARRVRARRDTGRIAGSDLFWIAATCCWPISLALFAAQAMAEAVTTGSRESRS